MCVGSVPTVCSSKHAHRRSVSRAYIVPMLTMVPSVSQVEFPAVVLATQTIAMSSRRLPHEYAITLSRSA